MINPWEFQNLIWRVSLLNERSSRGTHFADNFLVFKCWWAWAAHSTSSPRHIQYPIIHHHIKNLNIDFMRSSLQNVQRHLFSYGTQKILKPPVSRSNRRSKFTIILIKLLFRLPRRSPFNEPIFINRRYSISPTFHQYG